MLVRFHVAVDNTSHLLMLGSEPEALAAGQAAGEDPGITFWALHGDAPPACSRCSDAAITCQPAVRC